jgi:hypothetical protein
MGKSSAYTLSRKGGTKRPRELTRAVVGRNACLRILDVLSQPCADCRIKCLLPLERTGTGLVSMTMAIGRSFSASSSLLGDEMRRVRLGFRLRTGSGSSSSSPSRMDAAVPV